jgi:hypothetical protein
MTVHRGDSSAPCAFCDADLAGKQSEHTFDGRLRCATKACAEAERRVVDRSRPRRRRERVSYTDRNRRERSYVEDVAR